jgi:hypothetical protein
LGELEQDETVKTFANMSSSLARAALLLASLVCMATARIDGDVGHVASSKKGVSDEGQCCLSSAVPLPFALSFLTTTFLLIYVDEMVS